MMASISVVVPIYNVEAYLDRCINSILCQSYTDFDLILVDDGSPDRCGALCDGYAHRDPRVHVIHQSNKGLSAARNIGIDWSFSNSSSKWITFIDSDDWIHEQYLELLYQAAIQYDTKISSIGRFGTDGEDPLPPRTYTPMTLVHPMDIYNDIGGVVAVRKLYSKELYQEIRFPINKLHEDEFTTYLLLFSQSHIAKVDEPMYYYYRRPNSIMRQNWSLRRLDVIEAKESQLKYFLQNGFRDQYCITYRQYLNHLAQNYQQIQKNKPPKYKQYATMLRKKTRKAIRFSGSATKPTRSTHPHVYEVAYPITMFIYWTFKGLFSKIHKNHTK